MSAVDTAWLRMDRPHNLMVICGVLVFDRPVRLARLRKTIAQRFLVFDRFRSVPVEGASGGEWRTDANFDIRHHVIRHALPARAGRRELARYVSELARAPMPRDRPAWQFHLVDNVDGRSALVARIHHSYADGIALVRVMLAMTDASVDGPPAMPFATSERARTGKHAAGAGDTLSAALATARKIGRTIIDKGAEIWSDPGKAVALADQGSALAGEIATLAMMREDAATRFKGVPGVRKHVAWADPLALADVKTIGRALGASINDVVMTCVAGALAMYLRDKGDAVAGKTIRALVPVNLRPIERACDLGNQFGLVFVDLPLGIDNPVERLAVVRANMNALKQSHQPVLALGLLAAMGAGPRMLQEALLAALSRNATAVLTNVPGPAQALYMAGAKIDDLMFWVPQSGDIGLGLSVISYAGGVQFGVIVDHRFCPDPERIVTHFADAFETLVLATLMAPWPRGGDLDPDDALAAVLHAREAARAVS